MKPDAKESFGVPQFPKTLPGTFWGMTTFFNPSKYKNKLENYRTFRDASKKQGLKLLAVELAFFDEPFELSKEDADILIQVRSNSVLWQKERMLNIGLKNLPKDCDKVAWIDCDLLFKDDDWIIKASKLLEKYIAVQLFSFYVSLPKGGKDTDSLDRAMIFNGFVRDFLKKREIPKEYNFFAPGGAWAARRSALEKFWFYDKGIVGSGDDVVAKGFFGENSTFDRNNFSSTMKKSHDDWIKKTTPIIKGSIFYLNNIIFHLWHGDLSDRKYNSRWSDIKEYDFNPDFDLRLNRYDCWEWSSGKRKLHYRVRRYFSARKEA